MEDNTPKQTRNGLPLPEGWHEQSGSKNSYAKFLASLSPEEYQQHVEKRGKKYSQTMTMRKTVQELWHSAITDNSGTWNSMLQDAAMSVLQRAIERGDPVAFNSISDRILGKVATTMTVNVKEQDTEGDILKQIQSMAMNSMEKQLEHAERDAAKHALEYTDEHTRNDTEQHTERKDNEEK